METGAALFEKRAEKLLLEGYIEKHSTIADIVGYRLNQQAVMIDDTGVARLIVTGTPCGNLYVIRDPNDPKLFHFCMPPGMEAPQHLVGNVAGFMQWVLKDEEDINHKPVPVRQDAVRYQAWLH
jgi:hypothetical protein